MLQVVIKAFIKFVETILNLDLKVAKKKGKDTTKYHLCA
jgi:hypothetical protein